MSCRCDLPRCLRLHSSLRGGGWEADTEHYGLNVNSASVETMLNYSFGDYSSGLLYLCCILVLLKVSNLKFGILGKIFYSIMRTMLQLCQRTSVSKLMPWFSVLLGVVLVGSSLGEKITVL